MLELCLLSHVNSIDVLGIRLSWAKVYRERSFSLITVELHVHQVQSEGSFDFLAVLWVLDEYHIQLRCLVELVVGFIVLELYPFSFFFGKLEHLFWNLGRRLDFDVECFKRDFTALDNLP